MRTTLNLDDTVVSEVIRVTKIDNRSEAIRVALSSYIKMKQRNELLLMRGNVDVKDNWSELRQLECQ